MIKFPTRPDCPPVLESKKVKAAREALMRKAAQGKKLSRADFKGKTFWGEMKKVLQKYQNGKCCFCERRRDANAEADVEHFRPMLKVTEDLDHPGYWWLAYEWSNLFFSCKACNSEYKKNHFPLVNETSRALTKDDDLSLEMPVLINPSFEEPADFIDYDWDSDPGKVFLVGKDPENRGRETIRILGLVVRDDLHNGRVSMVLSLGFLDHILHEFPPQHLMYRKAIQKLRRKTEPNQEYLGLVYCYIRRKRLEGLLDG